MIFDVHYKETNTNIQVKKQSNHPESCKKAIIKGFADRNRNLCSEEKLENAQRFTETVFVANGFSRKEVQKAMEEREKKGDSQEEFKEGVVQLPYVKGFSEKLRRIYNQFGVRVAFRCGERVKDVGNKVMSKLGNRKSHAVYEIPCLCGAVYCGQTASTVKERHEQHERNLRLARDDLENNRNVSAQVRINESHLVRHCVEECGLNPDWDKVRILATDKYPTSRKLRETYHTEKRRQEGKTIINDTDVNINQIWMTTLQNY